MAAASRAWHSAIPALARVVLLAMVPFGAAANTATADSHMDAGAVEPDGLTAVLSLGLRRPLNTKSDWRVTALQAAGEEGRFGNVPARICFRRGTSAAQDCTILTHAATNDADRLVYQTVTGLSVTQLLRSPVPVRAVLAQAEMSYGGSGSSTQYALWTYHAGQDGFAPLATFQVSEQGEMQIIDDGALAGSVVTADYIWGDGETHFSRHRFAVTLYRLNPVTLAYTNVLRYVTAGKYPSLDEGGVDVVGPETPQILRILRFVYPHGF